MILIKHLIFLDSDNDKVILVNSLDGISDKVDTAYVDIIKKWQDCEKIVPEGELETSLFNSLKARGYIIESSEEEKHKKDKIIDILRKNHNEGRKRCNHITFIMTYDCNFRCPYCFEEGLTSKQEVITPELIDIALNFAGKALELITLYGGEPLLPKNKESIKHLVSKASNKTFSIITNGYCLIDFFDILSPVKIHSIMVTLDGMEEMHNSRRFLANGDPTFSRILEGVQKFLEIGAPVCIRMNLEPSDIHESNTLREFLGEKFSDYKDILSFEVSSMFGQTDEEKVKTFTEVYKTDIGYSLDERKSRNRLLGAHCPIVNNATLGTKLQPVYSYCYAHSENSFVFDPYGDMYTCFVVVGVEQFSVGKYYPELKFKEHSIHTRNIDTIPECRECKYSLLCGGGCPIRLGSSDNLYRPDCTAMQLQVHELLPKLYQINDERKAKIKGGDEIPCTG